MLWGRGVWGPLLASPLMGAPLHAAQVPKHSGGRGEWRSIQGKGRDFDNVETIV